MSFKKEYVTIAIAYLLVVLYIILINNQIISSLLVAALFVYHIIVFSQLKNKLSQDKESSVSRLLSRLDKSKKEQEESYKRFISLSRNLGSGLLMIDSEGKIQLANKDINEYFKRDFNNTDYEEHTDIKQFYKFLYQAYLLETSMRDQIIYEDCYYDLISTPLFEKNMFKGSLILVNDITLIKNAEKFQKRFTADVSHELRTPLAAIKGFSEILSRDEEIDKKDHDEFIKLINKESYRMETILNDLMVISKMDRIDYELNMNSMDVKDLVDECVSVLANNIKSKGLDYSVNVESSKLFMDKVKMSQVIINIVKNAMNYTDEGRIDIVGKKDKNNYLIMISDTGIGIKEENLSKIFKRFYRVDKARSRDTGGSGLGLSISKNVVNKHNGTIMVESKLNEGTTFIITLPIKE